MASPRVFDGGQVVIGLAGDVYKLGGRAGATVPEDLLIFTAGYNAQRECREDNCRLTGNKKAPQ